MQKVLNLDGDLPREIHVPFEREHGELHTTVDGYRHQKQLDQHQQDSRLFRKK